MQLIASLEEIMDYYDGYIVDIWGVLYNGVTLSPAALACLLELRRRSKKVALLSNAPRLSTLVFQILEPHGLTQHHFNTFVTSGDYLKTCIHDFIKNYGSFCYGLCTPQHSSLWQDLPCQMVETPEKADFALLAAPPYDATDVDPFKKIVDTIRTYELPMLCANPDHFVMIGEQKLIAAGSLAHYYESLGGKVVYIGKPHPEIYTYTLQHFEGINRTRILCIGDSLHTDMQGARLSNMDGLWILGGVHNSAFTEGKSLQTSMADVCQHHQEYPSYAMRTFC